MFDENALYSNKIVGRILGYAIPSEPLFYLDGFISQSYKELVAYMATLGRIHYRCAGAPDTQRSSLQRNVLTGRPLIFNLEQIIKQ